MRRLPIYLMVILGLFLFSCSEDDDSGTDANDDAKPWVGTWLSADANIAPILATVFQLDSVRVEITENQIVKTHQHVIGGAWTTVEGTYVISKADPADEDDAVHSVEFVYAAFSQEGIIQVTSGTPDMMQLEVVQTLPDIGATPRTPADGFGSDVTLGPLNIQKYVREQ